MEDGHEIQRRDGSQPRTLVYRSVVWTNIRAMRTYSHALLTWAATRRLGSTGPEAAVWGAVGATLPDLPALVGIIWLGAKKRSPFGRREFCEEACEKGPFGGPDAALHSALPVAALLALYVAPGMRGRDGRGALLAFLLGWAGHVLADALTHAGDARPVLWPLSRRRFGGPISYWDRAHHARPFALLEHAALLVLIVRLLSRGSRS